MTFPVYPACKESVVDWVGRVPAHWSVCALNFRYEVALGKMLDQKRITGDFLAPYIRNVHVQWGRIETDDLPTMDFSGNDLVRFALKPGDLLVCEGGEVGRAAVWEGAVDPCFYQKALHRLRPRKPEQDLAKFVFYVLRAAADLGVFEGSEGRATIAHLTGEALQRYRFPFPPPAEQSAIAAFLDRETGKIDALVAEQERLIALLKEKRQAVISQAVTKGLDASAPMKDSGVAWLGQVPAHWEVKRVKHVTQSIEQGWSPQCDGFPVSSDDEWGVLKVGCVNGGRFNPEENKSLPADLTPIPELGIAAGDVLISRANTRELVGGAACVSVDHRNLLLCDKLYRLRLNDTTCLPEWLAIYLRTDAARGQIELAASGASQSMVNIGQGTILDLPIPLPLVAEQRVLVDEIEARSRDLDTLTTEAHRAIALLRERRAALISAAVTGKIDVRGVIDTQETKAA